MPIREGYGEDRKPRRVKAKLAKKKKRTPPGPMAQDATHVATDQPAPIVKRAKMTRQKKKVLTKKLGA